MGNQLIHENFFNHLEISAKGADGKCSLVVQELTTSRLPVTATISRSDAFDIVKHLIREFDLKIDPTKRPTLFL